MASLLLETSRQGKWVCRSYPIGSDQPGPRDIRTRSTTSSVPFSFRATSSLHSLRQRPRRFLSVLAKYNHNENHIPTFAPSTVPSRRAPPRASFILLYTHELSPLDFKQDGDLQYQKPQSQQSRFEHSNQQQGSELLRLKHYNRG